MADNATVNAVELRDRIANGAVSCVDVAKACLDQIEAADGEIRAWAFVDRDLVMKHAAALDAYRGTGRPLGPLHGVPVGVKDIIDTKGMPTENGTEADKGRVPNTDAAVVERLKAAGALILGKTVTTECAFMHPSHTRNPANADHTPGGSSSGSAAAVAAGMVPLAIGTQTAGSVIRPASYCGTVGFKPTFGAISRRGVLTQAPHLDTIGVFAKSTDDAALLCDALFGHDPADPATEAAPSPLLLEAAQTDAPVKPNFAFVRTPYWERAEQPMRQALEELVSLLGDQCVEIELPEVFAEADEARKRIQTAELAKNFYSFAKRGGDTLSPELRAAIEHGATMPARDYIAALDWPGIYNAALDELFGNFDAILTPPAPGPAPAGFESTGDPVFNGLWTLCGLPTVTLPLFETEDGLPMGVQLVGPRHGDGRLLRTANWLTRRIAAA